MNNIKILYRDNSYLKYTLPKSLYFTDVEITICILVKKLCPCSDSGTTEGF